MQADRERPPQWLPPDKQKIPQKNQKTFEKPLDKRLRMWYNSRAFQKAAASEGSHRSLTIEQQEIKVQAKLVRNLEISLKKKS